jgi:hypothetical protein
MKAAEWARTERHNEELMKQNRKLRALETELIESDEKRRNLLSRVQRLERDREDCGKYILVLSAEKREMELTLIDVAKALEERDTSIDHLSELHELDAKRLNSAQTREVHLKNELNDTKQQLLSEKHAISGVRYGSNGSGGGRTTLLSPIEASSPLSHQQQSRSSSNRLEQRRVTIASPTSHQQRQQQQQHHRSDNYDDEHYDGGPGSDSPSSQSSLSLDSLRMSRLPQKMTANLLSEQGHSPDSTWGISFLTFTHYVTIVVVLAALVMWVLDRAIDRWG